MDEATVAFLGSSLDRLLKEDPDVQLRASKDDPDSQLDLRLDIRLCILFFCHFFSKTKFRYMARSHVALHGTVLCMKNQVLLYNKLLFLYHCVSLLLCEQWVRHKSHFDCMICMMTQKHNIKNPAENISLTPVR